MKRRYTDIGFVAAIPCHLADLNPSENFHSVSVWSKTDNSYLYPTIFSTVQLSSMPV